MDEDEFQKSLSLVKTLGNLILVNQSLNSKLSNGEFYVKKKMS